tara:strand:- start:506 stop:880 length:375 start_codon:yes stop_codon:yes gene_type:complete
MSDKKITLDLLEYESLKKENEKLHGYINAHKNGKGFILLNPILTSYPIRIIRNLWSYSFNFNDSISIVGVSSKEDFLKEFIERQNIQIKLLTDHHTSIRKEVEELNLVIRKSKTQSDSKKWWPW